MTISIKPTQVHGNSISIDRFMTNRSHSSIGAQDLGRVSAQCAEHGGQCRNESGEKNGTGRRSYYVRIGGFDMVENRPDITRRAKS